MPELTTTTMTPPTSDHGWIYEALERLRTDMTAQHVRLREDMNHGFDAIRGELRRETERLDDHSDRITTIEASRLAEEKQALKHGTWAGIVTSTLINVGITGAKWLAGK